MSACICDIATWMKSNRLQLNSSKTEVLWCAAPRQQHSIADASMRVCTDDVKPAKSVGIHIDSDMSMTTHVSRTVFSCFTALRHMRSIRRSVSQPLYTSLVLSRLDYGSITLNGITRRLMDRLQSVLNAAARLVVTVVSTIGSRRSYAICTGCAILNSSVWPFLCFAAVTRPHMNTSRETCSGLMTTSLADDYTIGDNSQAGCASHTTPNNQWSCVLCCRTSSVEQSAYTDVVTASSVATFKQRLKTFMFTQSFDVWRTVTFVVTCPWSLGLRQAKYWRNNNNNNNKQWLGQITGFVFIRICKLLTQPADLLQQVGVWHCRGDVDL